MISTPYLFLFATICISWQLYGIMAQAQAQQPGPVYPVHSPPYPPQQRTSPPTRNAVPQQPPFQQPYPKQQENLQPGLNPAPARRNNQAGVQAANPQTAPAANNAELSSSQFLAIGQKLAATLFPNKDVSLEGASPIALLPIFFFLKSQVTGKMASEISDALGFPGQISYEAIKNQKKQLTPLGIVSSSAIYHPVGTNLSKKTHEALVRSGINFLRDTKQVTYYLRTHGSAYYVNQLVPENSTYTALVNVVQYLFRWDHLVQRSKERVITFSSPAYGGPVQSNAIVLKGAFEKLDKDAQASMDGWRAIRFRLKTSPSQPSLVAYIVLHTMDPMRPLNASMFKAIQQSRYVSANMTVAFPAFHAEDVFEVPPQAFPSLLSDTQTAIELGSHRTIKQLSALCVDEYGAMQPDYYEKPGFHLTSEPDTEVTRPFYFVVEKSASREVLVQKLVTMVLAEKTECYALF